MKFILLSFVFFALCLSGFSKEKSVESVWTESALNINGVDDDWAGTPFAFEKKVEVDFAFKNDANDLYVLFIFKNPKYLSTIRGSGMTMWFNTEGKKKKKYGINFMQKKVTADDLISILEMQKGPLPKAEKQRIKSSSQYFLYQGDVIDKKGKSLNEAALDGELEAPIFRSKEKQKMMAYEFRVPLKILNNLSPNQRLSPGKMVKIGFEWGGMTKAMKEARMKKRTASRNPQAPQPAGSSEILGASEVGGGGGSRYPGSMPSGRKTLKKYSFWLDVKLAQK